MCKPAIQCCLIWLAFAVIGAYGVFHISREAWFYFPVALLWGGWVVIGDIVFLTELSKRHDKVAVWLFSVQVAALLVWGILR